VRVGVDGDVTAHLEREREQATRRIEPLRPAVDLDGDTELSARFEHELGVELRLGPDLPATPLRADVASGAMPEDVRVRVGHRGDHAARHVLAIHSQLGVHGGDHDVELVKKRRILVERPVFEDVDLDPGEDLKRRELVVESPHDLKLLSESFGREPTRDGQTRRVVSQRDVVVAEVARGPRHLLDGRAAVAPVGMCVQITTKRRAKLGPSARDGTAGAVLERDEITHRLTGDRLGDDGRGDRADAAQLAEGAVVEPTPELAFGQTGQCRGGPPERLNAIGRLEPALEKKGDAVERIHRAARRHVHGPTLPAGTRKTDHVNAATGPQVRAATVKRLRRAAPAIAAEAATRMEETLPWFAAMSPNQRSWIGLVAQAGIASFVEWLAHPSAGHDVTGGVFATAPREMARSVTLQQTVELVRVAVDTVEEHARTLAVAGDEDELREAVLRYSRELAFQAALVYAQAAEERGAWDARLEALVVDAVVAGEPGPELLSRAGALGWTGHTAVAVMAGTAGDAETQQSIDEIRRVARRDGFDVLASVGGRRLVCVIGVEGDPMPAAALLAGQYAPGPVVLGPPVADLAHAPVSARAALAGLSVADAWPGAPRPVCADALLPERALAGDAEAREKLVDIYRIVSRADTTLVDTLTAFLDVGGSLEGTARALFVHPNTVRYRLKRLTELTGLAATDPRDRWALAVAAALGRLATAAPAT
jgi:sugar diacid utilization regulator